MLNFVSFQMRRIVKYKLHIAALLLLLVLIFRGCVPLTASLSTTEAEVGVVITFPWVPGPHPVSISSGDASEIITVTWPSYLGYITISMYCLQIVELLALVMLLVCNKTRRRMILASCLINLLMLLETITTITFLFNILPESSGSSSSISCWSGALSIILLCLIIIIKIIHFFINSNAEYRMEYHLQNQNKE